MKGLFRLVKVSGVVIGGAIEEMEPRRSYLKIKIDNVLRHRRIASVSSKAQMLGFGHEHGPAGSVVEGIAHNADLVLRDRCRVERLVKRGLIKRPEILDGLVRERS